MEIELDKLTEEFESLSMKPALPIVLFEVVIDHSSHKDQLRWRKVCRTLRALVDKSSKSLMHLIIRWEPDQIHCTFNKENSVVYSAPNTFLMSLPGDPVVLRDDYEQWAIRDLEIALNTRNPPKLKSFWLTFDGEEIEERREKMLKFLKSLNRQISTESIHIQASMPADLLNILQFLKPRVLQNIHLDLGKNGWNEEGPVSRREIENLSQWKFAEELELKNGLENGFPIEMAMHFKRFVILEKEKVSGEKLVKLRENFAKMANFERCKILMSYTTDKNLFFARPARKIDEIVSHYPIAGSNYYLECSLFECCAIIEKKIKE